VNATLVESTDQSLSQALGIDALEVARRKRLLGFTEADAQVIRQTRDRLPPHLNSIVGGFYEWAESDPVARNILGQEEASPRLKAAMRGYLEDLFEGEYGLAYVERRLRIGLVHRQIGVDTTLYLTAVKRLESHLFRVLHAEVDRADRPALFGALEKLLCFDTTLAFEMYTYHMVTELEGAKARLESYMRGLEARAVELEELVRLDPLTGLFNRRAFMEALRHDLLLARRTNSPLALMYLDVDQFKAINDSLGHQMGDEVLRDLSRILAHAMRETDTVCRYGGDEFVVSLPGTTIGQAREVCERLTERLAMGMDDVGVSIGLAQTGPTDFINEDELIRAADARMYLAKRTHGVSVVDRDPGRVDGG
jgi:diguanylate cyclase (GGDEF)-like protein